MQNVEQVLSGLTPILVGDTQSAQILDALPVAVYATDPEGRITYYNQAAADFWGLRAGDWAKIFWCGSWKLYWPDGTPLPHDECPMASHHQGRSAPSAAWKPSPSAPTARACRLFPIRRRCSTGRASWSVPSTCWSTFQRTQTRRAMPARHFAAIVENTDDAILSVDLEGTIGHLEPRCRTTIRPRGRRDHRQVGQCCSSPSGSTKSEEAGLLERVGRGEHIHHYETVRLHKDGRAVGPVSLSVSPIRGLRGGGVIGASKIAHDITARKHAANKRCRNAPREQTALYEFTDRLFRAGSAEDVYQAALDAIVRALGCERASILLFDNTGVMKFVAWRGLSDGYRGGQWRDIHPGHAR